MRNSSIAVIAGAAALAGAGVCIPHAATRAQGAAPASAPRQVQIKFEWVTASRAPKTAPEKQVEALVLLTEEGKTAKVSSSHLRNGSGTEQIISVLPRVLSGNVVALTIAEQNQDIDGAGATKSDSSQTQVKIKDGQTSVVRGMISKQHEQSSERLLFVTPTLLNSPSAK